MKILYVTNHNRIAMASGGFVSDYQNDLTFYGLRELYGDDVVDSTQIIATSPAYAITGLVDISASSTYGTATLHGAFTYT